MPKRISIDETSTSTTNGVRSTSKTPRAKPGKAWKKVGKFWVAPKEPAGGNSAWDDNQGWVTAAERATAWEIPLAVINSDTGLTTLFNEAWAAEKKGQEWSKEKFIGRLQTLPWYMEKSQAQREYWKLSKDPAQAVELQKQIKSNAETVKDAAGLMGVTLTDAQATELAHSNLQNGFSPSELQNVISGYINFSGQTDEEKIGSLFGEAGNSEDNIRDWATKNNVTISNDWVLSQVKGIASADYDVNKSRDYITNIAKQQYAGWADKITNDTSVYDLSAGYRQLVGYEFDATDSSIDLKNKWVNTAMTTMDDKGMPIGNDGLLKTMRKSDEWADVTKNKDKIYGIADDVLKRFGIR